MKILYVAKHDSGDNDDEGAIAHALEVLGHKVEKLDEFRRRRYQKKPFAEVDQDGYDFCLFHKWDTVSEVQALRVPAVFWHFDMIQPVDGDPTLMARSWTRVQWMRDILSIPMVKLGFCTDGDWVAQDQTGKLRWLMQGADERTLGFGANRVEGTPDVIFTGMVKHGQRRAAHVDRLRQKYGGSFGVVGEGGPKRRVHGRRLADVFSSCKIVVAPDGPNTDRYWSNRVYLTLGLGGFLVHPRCAGLRDHYHAEELVRYDSREHLEALIDEYLPDDAGRQDMAVAGFEATKERNLYRHRVEELVRQVREVI